MTIKNRSVSDVQIQASIRSGAKSIALGEGLKLRLLPSGSYAYQANYLSPDGKQKTFSAGGTYPSLPLHVARERYLKARCLLYDGLDPLAVKAEKKAAAKAAAEIAQNTFKTVAEAWLERYAISVVEKTLSGARSKLINHVYPMIGKLPISAVTPKDIADVLLKIENGGKGSTAKRAQDNLHQIFVYASARGMVKGNPVSAIKGILQPVVSRHFACIDKKELPDLLRKIDAYDGHNAGDVTKFAMQLMLLVFLRTGELIKARWSDFSDDLTTWTIPAAIRKQSKGKKAIETNVHIVPLPAQARKILKKLRDLPLRDARYDWVFPSPFSPSQPISNNTILGALGVMGYRSNDYSVPTAYGYHDVFVRGYVDSVVITWGPQKTVAAICAVDWR